MRDTVPCPISVVGTSIRVSAVNYAYGNRVELDENTPLEATRHASK